MYHTYYKKVLYSEYCTLIICIVQRLLNEINLESQVKLILRNGYSEFWVFPKLGHMNKKGKGHNRVLRRQDSLGLTHVANCQIQ